MNSLRDPTRQGGVVPTLCCAGGRAPVALLAHLKLNKPVRVRERGIGLSAMELGPFRCCKVTCWSSNCLLTPDSRPARVVCEGRRLGAAATDCELAAFGLDGLRSFISKALYFPRLARAGGRHGCPCLSAGDDTLKAHCNEADTNADDGYCQHQICIKRHRERQVCFLVCCLAGGTYDLKHGQHNSDSTQL